MAQGKDSSLEKLMDELSTMLLVGESDHPTIRKCVRAITQALLPFENVRELRNQLVDHLANSGDTLDSDLLAEMMTRINSELRSDGIEQNSAVPTCATELAPNIDHSLLIEFIERHTQGIEELEAELLDGASNGLNDSDESSPEAQQFSQSIKRYIHTLKGDSGSVGMIGIELACHKLEDHLQDLSPVSAIEPLLSFCNWVDSCNKAFSNSSCPTELSEAFMKRMDNEFAAITGARTDSPSSVEAAGDLPSYANLDLLAELLAEQDEASQEVAPEESERRQIEGDMELVAEFIAESEDHLTAVENTLLESSGELDKEAIDKIFRAAHSLKGASAYFKLDEIRESSHLTEDILDEVRTGKRSCDNSLITLLLTYKDLQLELLGAVRAAVGNGGYYDSNPSTSAYIKELKHYKDTGKVASKEQTPKATSQEVVKVPTERKEAGEGSKDKLEVKTFVKVETQRLDQLIDSIGEMVIYSSMLIQSCRDMGGENEELRRVTYQVEKFSRDLQSIGMSMRLIPIRGLFQKLSRLVWDTSKKIGKDIKFTMDGEDTELDRNIIDQLADPLMHMVRNSIDHGIEPPDERERAGKSRQGSVTLSASHSGGCIQIQITDNGRGLDPQKLIAKAVEKGIINPGQQLSTSEAHHLIFAPGFSTAAAVTDISGRGVGMDVVRRNIEAMHGQVHIDSQVGKGTVFTIDLPLTLAIIDGLLVSVGEERFLLPTLSTVELIKAKPGDIVKAFDCAETFMFRGKCLPLYRMSELFDIDGAASAIEDGTVVVVESVKGYSALFFDNVLGCYSTIIKSISECFKDKRGIAGCAIMPNGSAALILDVRSLLSVAVEEYRFKHDSIEYPSVQPQ